MGASPKKSLTWHSDGTGASVVENHSWRMTESLAENSLGQDGNDPLDSNGRGAPQVQLMRPRGSVCPPANSRHRVRRADG
jgi:hypothetical protein